MNNQKFEYYQPNKKDTKNGVGDFPVRVFCKILNTSWVNAYDFLSRYAREAQCMINQKACYEKALSDLGWKYKEVKGKTTVLDITKQFENETVICNVRYGCGKYLIVVENGKYYDTTNLGSLNVYGYYKKE